MKKQKKYLVFILLIIFILQLFMNKSFAATVTAETFQESLQGYADGTKTAEFIQKNADGSTTTVSLKASEPIGKCNVKVTDDQIEFKSSNYEVYIDVEGEENIVKFNLEGEITSAMGQEESNWQITRDLFLENCFIALTDLFSINSNDSLYFIENNTNIFRDCMTYIYSDISTIKEELIKAKTVSNEVIKYYTTIKTDTPEELKWITTLEVNMNNINSTNIPKYIALVDDKKEDTNTNIATGSTENTTKDVKENITKIPNSGKETTILPILYLIIIVAVSLVFILCITSRKNNKQLKKS